MGNIQHGENLADDMTAGYDCHINIREFPDIFDDDSVNALIANLNDWD